VGAHIQRSPKLQSDLLYSVQLAGSQAFIYLLFEHQSTPDARMPWRMLRYMVRIWERFATDFPAALMPVIVPIVLHHGERRWSRSTQLREVFDVPVGMEQHFAPFVLDFTLVLDDLAVTDDAALRAGQLTELARVTLVLLQRCRDAEDPIEILQAWTGTLAAVLGGTNGVEAIARVLRYISLTTPVEADRLRDFAARIGPGAEEAFMTLGERLLEQGRTQGQAALLLRLLGRRFGPISAEAQARIEHADTSELETWGDRVLSAATLEELLGDR
jgi:predicted transposase YdaD